MAERELFDFGTGFILGGLGKIIANTWKYVGASLNVGFSIFKKIEAAGPLYEGTQLPKYFTLVTDEGRVFIKHNATEHLWELLVTSVKQMVKGGHPYRRLPHWLATLD